MGLTVNIKYSFLGSAKILVPRVSVFNLTQTVCRSHVSRLHPLRVGMKRSNSLVAIYGSFGNSHQATEAQWLKNLPANAGHGFDPWVRKIPWRRTWQPMEDVENPMKRGAWRATVHGVAKDTTEHTQYQATGRLSCEQQALKPLIYCRARLLLQKAIWGFPFGQAPSSLHPELVSRGCR